MTETWVVSHGIRRIPGTRITMIGPIHLSLVIQFGGRINTIKPPTGQMTIGRGPITIGINQTINMKIVTVADTEMRDIMDSDLMMIIKQAPGNHRG